MKQDKQKKQYIFLKIFLSFIVIFSVYLFIFGNFIPFLQTIVFMKGINKKSANILLEKNIILSPYTNIQTSIRRTYFSAIQKTRFNDPKLATELAEKLIDVYKRDEKRGQYYPLFFTQFGQIYDVQNIYLNKPEGFLNASLNYKKAYDLFPKRQEVSYFYILDLLSNKKYNEAVNIAKKTYEDDDRVLDSVYYYGLSLVSFPNPEFRQGLDLLEKAIDSGANLSPEISRKVYIDMFFDFYKKKDKDSFIIVCKRLVQIDSERNELYLGIIDYVQKNNKLPYLEFE